MNVTETRLPGVLMFEPRVFGDTRGFFVETFRQSIADAQGIPPLVQHNQSRSRRGVLRGLHWQQTDPQGKLVRAATGRIYDVAVDIRRGSSTFGQWFGAVLDDVSHRMLYIPPDFAHGFAVLSETADVVYQCTRYYNPPAEAGIAWNDPDLAIEWPAEILDMVQLSEKDRLNPRLRDLPPDRLPE